MPGLLDASTYISLWNLNYSQMTAWKTGTDLGKTPVLELISDYLQNKIEELIQSHKIWKGS